MFLCVCLHHRHSNFKRETKVQQNQETAEAKQLRVPSIVTGSVAAADVQHHTRQYKKRRSNRDFDPHQVQQKLKSSFIAKNVNDRQFFNQPEGFKAKKTCNAHHTRFSFKCDCGRAYLTEKSLRRHKSQDYF
jgi:hypothetical protein